MRYVFDRSLSEKGEEWYEHHTFLPTLVVYEDEAEGYEDTGLITKDGNKILKVLEPKKVGFI